MSPPATALDVGVDDVDAPVSPPATALDVGVGDVDAPAPPPATADAISSPSLWSSAFATVAGRVFEMDVFCNG